jgi:hypothetical protein
MFIASLLLAAAPAAPFVVDPLPYMIISVNTEEVKIFCSNNTDELHRVEDAQIITLVQISSLRQRRLDGSITAKENEELFRVELMLTGSEQISAARRFAEYFCKHPDEIPEEVETRGL